VRLGVGPGDALTVSLVHDSLVLVPAPRDVVEVTYGSARAMWREAGGSAAYIREAEESWRA
jgi:hypothetical protein